MYLKFNIPISLIILLTACIPQAGEILPTMEVTGQTPAPALTPLPTRPEYAPGELVDYLAQTGDTLPALAAHFNSSIQEIREANPTIPEDATSMPPGMPMKIPIYYLPFRGTIYQILPDSQFINGPGAVGFDTESFVDSQPGWLKNYQVHAADDNLSGAKVVDLVATNYSINQKVLLAILEYQTGALTQAVAPSGMYLLGEVDYKYAGLYMQLIWAANLLNNGYYGWRTGSLIEFEHVDSSLERPDPWQTAASVAFQYYFSRHFSADEYARAIGPGGLAWTYQTLFGNPWEADQPHIPASLQQPVFAFPFPTGKSWTLTGGPHSGWGTLLPWAALDFAPPAVVGGCIPTAEITTAVADGLVVRSETGVVMLDLDMDGDERTGWNILYLHIATTGRASVGRELKRGDPVGYPSCEGGMATGTHVHIARKYNGEWIPVDSSIAYVMDGWVAHIGNAPYRGSLTRGNQTVTACECSDAASQVTSGR